MAKVLFNSQGLIETPTLLLQHKNFETIGNGGITNVSGLTYKNNFNDANEVSFKIHKFNNEKKHPLWDSMVDFKIIYIPQLHERFEISVTTSEEDPNDVSKSITGTSLCEAELSQITLRNVQINTETDMTNPLYDENFPTILYRDPEEYDSVENLAIWAKSKYDYLRDKTAYPTEESVIARKKTILKHASLLHRVLEKAPHYSISCVADTLKKLKTVHEFTFDGTDILSALKDTIADDFHCVFIFNSENRTISVLDLYSTCNNCGYRGDYMDECPECGSNNITNKYGEDTNILINSTNLTTQITLDSNSDSLKNCFYITGADDTINAAIANVNPNGTQYIYYFSNETLADMPTELQSKLRSYNTLYDEINTTREYNFKTDRVAEYNKVINYINTKFASMSKDDQDKIEYPTLTSPLVGYPALTSAWYSAMDVYYFLNDSMMPVIDVDGMGLDDSITSIQDGLKDLGGIAVTGIKTITQSAVKGSVESLVKTFFSASYYDMNITDSSLSDYDSSTDKRTWSGTIILTSHSQMDENNQYLTKSVKITTDVIESTEKYIEQKITRMTNRADEIKDKQITSIKLAEDKFKEQLGYYSLVELNNLKKEFEACRDIAVDGFTDESVDVQYNNSELKDKYVNFYSGRIVDIQNEIKTRESQIEAVNAVYNTEKSTGEIQDIVNSVKTELDLENYLGEELYMLWYSYRREDDYSNDNYSSTGLDDVTLIKRATELVEAAQKELYKAGNLQYSLSATMGNLLALDEFKPIKDKFEVGNFIKVGIDDRVYSLRLMSYETDFDSIQDMPVEFSTVEKVYTGYSDVQSVLDASRSMATSYSSVKDQADKSKKTTDTVNDWSDNGINGDNTQFINSSEQTILINKNGILGRSYDDQLDEFSLKQFKLVNNGMYFTKDGWQSIETGIGRFTYRDINGNLVEDYGIIAKTVVGNLIIGKELQIYNEDKSIVIDENGLTIDGGYLKIKGTEVGSDGKTISEVIIDLDTAQKLVALAQQAADKAQESANQAQASADKANKATEDLKVETNEIRELAEKGVDHVTTCFYQSDSATELVGGEWTTNSVTWISGKYVWQKVITYYKDGTDNSQTAKAICISGANGQDGKPGENGVKGKGVKSITPQYAISDSNVLQPNEGWSDKEPAWSEGKYIWTRTLVVYDDNTQETTTPIVSNGLNSALSISTAARKQADSAKSTADSANTTASEAKSTADSASQTANKASENATSAVDKANTANTNASNALSAANSADQTAQDASTKADAATKIANSASEKADSANANASSAIDISNSAKGIANQAKSDAIADTDKKLTSYSTTEQMNAAIKTSADSITSTVSKTYSTKEEVANIQVGGRNLIAISTSIDNKRIIENYNYDNLYADTGFRTSALISCKEGDSFTLSSFAEGFLSFGWINSNKNVFSRPTGYHTVTSKYSKTFIAPSGTAYCAVSWSKNNLDHNLKLEKGNKATDWTPAPEDVDSDISTAKADAISSANASTDEKLKSYETITNVDSKISQSATDITSTVKKTYETIDNVNKVRTSVTEAETKAQQSLDQFLWLVKSGSSSTSLTLTDAAVTAITKQFTIKSPDGSATIIEGGKLKTDALKSNNYVAGNDGTYSAFGTFLDLSNGEIHTPGFYLDSVGSAFYQGTVNADAGYFGDANNNWYIGSAEFDNIRNKDDALVNGVEYSALISKGNAALTAGHWYLMSQDGSLGIQSGWTTINGGNYVFDKETQKYYDMGMVEPIFGSKNEWDNKFLYIRRVKDPSSSQSTWEYLFKVDKDGTIYENGTKLSDKYARKDAVGSTYLPLTGGTVTGNLTVNGTLTATASKANQLTHTLSVNGKSWNGSADLTVGTMGVAYGGTGKSSWTANGIIYASASGTLSQLALGTAGYILQSGGASAPSWVNPSTLNVASAIKATQDGNGNTISDTYLRKDFDSVGQNVSFDGSVDVDDLTAGTLLVSGAARFANGLIGNLKGTASNVPWSGITDKPKTFAPSAHTHTMANISDWETYVYSAQGTRTKNTVLAAPNGSDGKATFRTLVEADIPALSKSKVGLSNVDNTADSTKNVLSASKLTTARNITIGLAKKSFDGASDISFSLADIGASASGHTHNYASKVTLAGTNYSCVSNVITITKANLQTAIGSTGLGLMTAEERSKLNSIKVSTGGTIDFSGVTASGALAATVGDDKTVAITHNVSGVKAGAYKSVTVDTYGHVTAGTNPTTLSGYGITDALSSSTKYALSDSVGGNALKANLLANLFSSRPTDANVAGTGSGGLATFKATNLMTANKPKSDGHILHFYWDNTAGYDGQLFMSASDNPELQMRGQKAGVYGSWKTVLSSNNYTDYVPQKDGTGASGTWGISITGNAATATKATSADSATKATQDGNGNVISSTYLPLTGGNMTGTIASSASQILRWTYSATSVNSTGCSWYGLGTYRADDGYNWLNISNYWGINFTTTNSNRFTHNGNIIITSANIGSQSVASATKATQDGAGNVITSKYVTIDTAQTISGAKTFSKETTISSATVSTSKTTGALKVKGGIASEGQISADKVMIGDKCALEYDANLQCLNFVFA